MLAAGLAAHYDGDILQYSDNQIADFETGLHPYRFDLDSPDDLVYSPTLALRWDRDAGAGRRRTLRLKAARELHARNGAANFSSGSLSWRERFRGDRRLGFGYYALPDYYLRQLYDEDLTGLPATERYVRAAFDLQIGSIEWRQPLARDTRLAVGYQYEVRRYVPNFRERDSGTHQGEVGFRRDGLPRRGAIEFVAAYRLSRARAEDGDDPPGVTPDDADVSYHGFGAIVGGRMELTRGSAWQLGADVSYALSTRAYDSDRTFDVYHYRRSDVLHAVELGTTVQLPRRCSARIFYKVESNHADLGTAATPTSDSGSYHQDRFGVSFDWSYLLWRQTTIATADPGEEP